MDSNLAYSVTVERPAAMAANKTGQLFARVLRNTLSNYAGKFVSLAAGFLLTPFLISQLGPATYGLWVLVGSVVAYGSLLDLGIASAITKYTAEFRARNEVSQAQELVATTLLIYLLLGGLVILLSGALAVIFPYVFAIPARQHDQAVWLVLLSGLAVGIAIPCTAPTAILRGLHRFDLTNLLGITGTLLSVVATVAVLLLGWGVLGIVAANIVLTLVMQIPSIWLVRHAAPELRFDLRAVNRRLARTVTSFSSSLFVVNVAGQLQGKTDEIVIGLAMPLAQVTPYAVSRRLSDVARILTDQFIKVLLPLASELHAENDRARLQALYIVSTRVTLAGFMPFGLILAILAEPVLAAWVGREFSPYAPLVAILVTAGLIDMSQWPASHVLQGMARHRPLAVIALASGVANLVLSLVLIQSLGLVGVALGTLIPTAIECLILVMPYTLRVLGVSLSRAVSEIIVPGLLPAVPTALVLLGLRQLIQPSDWGTLALIALAGLLVYGGVYLTRGASGVERQAYYNLIQTLLKQVRSRWARG